MRSYRFHIIFLQFIWVPFNHCFTDHWIAPAFSGHNTTWKLWRLNSTTQMPIGRSRSVARMQTPRAAIGVVNHHFLLACRPSFVATQRRGLPGNKYRGFAELTLRCPSGVVTQRARDVSRPPKSEILNSLAETYVLYVYYNVRNILPLFRKNTILDMNLNSARRESC